MSAKKCGLILLVVFLAVATTGAIYIARTMYTPTQGSPIAIYPNPRKALLVIDVQEDYTGRRGKQPPLFKNVERPIATINELIKDAVQKGAEVAYIRQLFDNNLITRLFLGRTIEGLPGTEVDSRIKIVSRNDFTKKISDAFSNPKLEEFLVRNQVDEIYLVGLDAAYCVYYTALGARNRGYKVTVVKDAIMTRKKMDKILGLYKADGIRVTSSEGLIGKPWRKN